MSTIETFNTSSVAPPMRLNFWNQITASTFSGLAVDSPDDVFSARMARWRLGDLTMIRPTSQKATVHRWKEGAGERPDRLIFHLQHRGSCLNGQWSREAPLASGDFTIVHGGNPYFTHLSDGNEMLVVEMPRTALSSRIPDFEDHLCNTIAGTSPGTRIVHDFLLSLWRQGDQSEADPDWQDGIANVFYDLLAIAIRNAAVPQVSQATGDRILALIEARLSDPDLRTGTIAAELGVSLRTVQNALASMATTPSAYIQQRRLERAAERLKAAGPASITEVAFDLGFNDSAYFTRCFRQHFGVSPSEWRRRAAM